MVQYGLGATQKTDLHRIQLAIFLGIWYAVGDTDPDTGIVYC